MFNIIIKLVFFVPVSIALLLSINGCATSMLFEKKDGPHEIKIKSSGTFNQIYYKINKLSNNGIWSDERILCIPINVSDSNSENVIYYVIKKDWFNPSYQSALADTERYKVLLSKQLTLKSVEIINHNGKHSKGLYIYLTYDKKPEMSGDFKPLYPDKKFTPDETVPNDIITQNIVIDGNDRLRLHGSYYSYLVRHGQYQLESDIETKYDFSGYDKLLPDDSHKYTVNIMNSEAEHVFPVVLRYGLAPIAIAADVALSPFYLLMFSTADYWMPR
jgi:hypothetical protein